MNVTYSVFQRNKINRLIHSKGEMYEVTQFKLNEYDEHDESDPEKLYIRAIFHAGTPAKNRTGDGATTTFSRSEFLLCSYEDAKKKNLKIGDRIRNILSNQQYEIENVENVQEGNFAIELSLRRVIHGSDV